MLLGFLIFSQKSTRVKTTLHRPVPDPASSCGQVFWTICFAAGPDRIEIEPSVCGSSAVAVEKGLSEVETRRKNKKKSKKQSSEGQKSERDI